jgi:hypothetical protein
MSNQRKFAAELAKQYYQGSLTFNEFLMKFPDSDDLEIIELLALIEHEPQKGGLFGVSELEYFNYINNINNLIKKLEE